MLPWENLKFRSSKTAGNAPETRILLILSFSMGMHPYSGSKNRIARGDAAKIGSARTRSRRVLPYSADWGTLRHLCMRPVWYLLQQPRIKLSYLQSGNVFTFHFTVHLKEKILGKLLGSQNYMKGKADGQWNKISMGIFGSMLHVFLPSSPVSLTELCSLWYGLKDLFNMFTLADKVVLDR